MGEDTSNDGAMETLCALQVLSIQKHSGELVAMVARVRYIDQHVYKLASDPGQNTHREHYTVIINMYMYIHYTC